MAKIRRCKDGSWHLTATVYYYTKWMPPKTMPYEKQKEIAELYAMQFEEQCRMDNDCAEIPCFQDFAENWLTNIAPKQHKDRTIIEYRRYAKRAYQEFGLLLINKISLRILQNYILKLETEEENGKKRSPKTIRNYLLCISSIMNYAIQLGYITVNPCANLVFPKSKKAEPVVYDQVETERFLRLLMTDETVPLRYQCFFVLAIFGGYREGEILGFEWDDFDFQNCVVMVKRESVYTKEKGLYTDEPKTKRSVRCSKLPVFVIKLLQRYKEKRELERETFELNWRTTNRVFVSDTGRPLFPSAPLNWLRKFLKRHNLKNVNVHSFRHLNASLLITNGVDIQTVSEYLGHSTTATTLNFYSHTYEYVKACASEAVANAFPKSIQDLINHV